MKFYFNYLEHEISLDFAHVFAMEVENKCYFYRIVKDFLCLESGELPEEVIIFNEDREEQTIANRIRIMIDYFDFQKYDKRYNSIISKLLDKGMDDEGKAELAKCYAKLVEKVKKKVDDFDFSVKLKEEFTLEEVLKFLKITIDWKESIVENVMFLMDIEKCLGKDRIIVFINLKDYIAKEELIELYKYALYNKLYVLLIDSRSYGIALEYEKKLIIDSSLEEFMLECN